MLEAAEPSFAVALLFFPVLGNLLFPVLGNLRPDLVSFLPAMRQYAGNWASAVWTFRPGAEEKLKRTYLGDDLDRRVVWEGETGANLVLGWNFGDGHLHGIRFLEALREVRRFEPRGRWCVADCVAEQPWLPNGPVPLTVTWKASTTEPAP